MRKDRKTLYGLPIEDKEVAMKKTTQKVLTDEVTPYGAKKYRAPVRKGEFTGTKGTRPEAVILDIDGTIQGWGTGLDKSIESWLKKQYDADRIFVVITARDTWQYESSFNWLMKHLPYPFVGPFMRAVDDPRYASEFKRELAEDLSAVYEFVGAADDNTWVLKMWKQWAIDKFEDPADFDIFEAGYGSYAGWRSELPSKGSGWGNSYRSNTSYSTSAHAGEHWVVGGDDPVTGVFVSGHWEKDIPTPAEVKNRAAGTSRWAKDDSDPTPGHPVDISNDPRWAFYLAQREKRGGYSGVDRLDADLDDVTEVLDDEDRAQLEDIVAHDYNLTPGEIQSMTVAQLKDWAGVEDDTRELLLVNVEDWFKGRYTPDELELLSNEELSKLLDMTDIDADAFVTGMVTMAEVHGPRLEKNNYRLDLEEDVYAEYPDLTYPEIEKMDVAELEMLLSAADKLSGGQSEFQFTTPNGGEVA